MKQELLEREKAISFVKETFTEQLTTKLNLIKISSPIAILDGTGINDDLNGTERAVIFPVKSLNEQKAVIVHSLAKWKRIRLKQFEIEFNKGILTDMRALRPDENFTSQHSIYVDQWDWEININPCQRNLSFLKEIVLKIYQALKTTELFLHKRYSEIIPLLPPNITFIHSEELLKLFPDLSPKERENEICKQYGAVFIIGIGDKLSNGLEHDGRAADYDDWSTKNEDGFVGLNGDLIIWHPVLKSAFELSSMGIRVDKKALIYQLTQKQCLQKTNLFYHKLLLAGQLPESIGGGIGQSRLCMFMLRKSHIGEVQVGIWQNDTMLELAKNGITLL